MKFRKLPKLLATPRSLGTNSSREVSRFVRVVARNGPTCARPKISFRLCDSRNSFPRSLYVEDRATTEPIAITSAPYVDSRTPYTRPCPKKVKLVDTMRRRVYPPISTNRTEAGSRRERRTRLPARKGGKGAWSIARFEGGSFRVREPRTGAIDRARERGTRSGFPGKRCRGEI